METNLPNSRLETQSRRWSGDPTKVASAIRTEPRLPPSRGFAASKRPGLSGSATCLTPAGAIRHRQRSMGS